MTDLEDRIREALQDPRWQLPVWQDPMPRIRRAARGQRAVLAGAAAILLAVAAVLPLALMSRLGTRPPGTQASAAPTLPPREAGSSIPSWTKRLHGEVAYGCGGALCLMRPDRTGKRMLSAPAPQWDPAWSPDGRRLAFRGYYGPAKGDFTLYVVDANGCHLTKLNAAMNGTSPSWSPTGRQIAFVIEGINVINADGTASHSLTRDTPTYSDDSPAWSASNRIAFVRTRNRTSLGEIYTMNADGSRVAALTHGAPGFGEPSWSPDGKSIAFVANPPGTIEVANANGTRAHRVSPRSWTSYSPTWTPDRKVVFLTDSSAGINAYIVNPDGTGLRLLYHLADLVQGTQIAWGPASLPRGGC